MNAVEKALLSYLQKHDEVEKDLEKAGKWGDPSPQQRSSFAPLNVEYDPSKKRRTISNEPRVRRVKKPKVKVESIPQSTPPSAPPAQQGWSSDESIRDAIRATATPSSTTSAASPSGKGFKGDAGRAGIEQPSKPQIHHFIRSWEREQLIRSIVKEHLDE